jgi:hypothetical protein
MAAWINMKKMANTCNLRFGDHFWLTESAEGRSLQFISGSETLLTMSAEFCETSLAAFPKDKAARLARSLLFESEFETKEWTLRDVPFLSSGSVTLEIHR